MTRIYFEDETANETDPVLGAVTVERRSTLIATRVASNGVPTYRFDIYIQGKQETVFFDPA
jgi:protocatechuate 3,4-dioxygenase alpha subunit